MKRTTFFLSICLTFVLFLFNYQIKAQYTINSVYGNLDECDTMTRSIYIVWWDSDFDFSTQVDVLLDSMISYRNTCLNDLLMLDPPNTEDGYFYNVYIHVPGNTNDVFYPFGWGNGQGTDSNGYPYLTLPNGVLNDWVNNSHETFHIFQYNANSPGFSYSGDSQWYIEALANWFAATQNPTAERALIEGESLVRVPEVPLWLSYDNFPSYYPSNWQRYVHQYAMAMMLYYFTEEEGVSANLLTEGFFNGTEQLPQEYLFYQLGDTVFRNYFINWAAHMTNQFDFILPSQAEANENEWYNYADLWDDNEFIEVYENSGSDGWYQPDDSVCTNSWSFNTYKLLNTENYTYTFEIEGNPLGNYGDSACFQAKVVVQNSLSGTSFYNLNMINKYQGSLSLDLSSNDTTAFFIICSMPEVFEDVNEDFQHFSYEMQIRTSITDISQINTKTSHKEIARYNLIGQAVDSDYVGLQIILYDDGHTEKIIKY